MAKKSSHRKSVIKYLLFAVVALLVTVSLLSLFVFKYATFVSDSVLGAYVGPAPSAVTCENCAQFAKGSVAIILQQNGTDPKKWGAMCATEGMLKTVKFVYKIACPTPTPVKSNCPYSCIYYTKCTAAQNFQRVSGYSCNSSTYPGQIWCCKGILTPTPSPSNSK
jgi:hypothetical protein